MVHYGELKVGVFKASGGLLSRVAKWCKAKSGVSFRLELENITGRQGGVRAGWILCRVLK